MHDKIANRRTKIAIFCYNISGGYYIMGLPKKSEINLRSKYKKGSLNKITDVPGVLVGQITLNDDKNHVHTGVTAILPHGDNLFKNKVSAGVSVINGFGKSAGLIQIEELGNIESPIIMTNTFGVGTALNACIKYMLKQNEDIGVSTSTINSVVTECNDGILSDIRGMHVKESDVFAAIENTATEFDEGAVGAGRGMCCMGLKGGIGSSSRILTLDDKEYTIGSIVLSNFGVKGNLRIDGNLIDTSKTMSSESEKGSIIIVIGTDIPLADRQLKRVAKRATSSLGRVGSYLGNGSGDIAIAFSNTNIIPHYSEKAILDTRFIHDSQIDPIFEATVECVEEAIISALYHAETVEGIRDKTLHSLREFL